MKSVLLINLCTLSFESSSYVACLQHCVNTFHVEISYTSRTSVNGSVRLVLTQSSLFSTVYFLCARYFQNIPFLDCLRKILALNLYVIEGSNGYLVC